MVASAAVLAMTASLVATTVGTAHAAPVVHTDAAPPPTGQPDLPTRVKAMAAAADARRAQAEVAHAMHAGGPAMKAGAGALLMSGNPVAAPGAQLFYGSASAETVVDSKGNRTSAGGLGEGVGAVAQSAQATLPNGHLHVGMLTKDGRLYDNVRLANGDWTGPILVDGGTHTVAFAETALPNGELHFELLTDDGIVNEHTYIPGDYPAYNMGTGVAGTVLFDSLPGKVKGLAVAGLPNNDLHLELLTADGKVWTNVRHSSGNWDGVTAADGGATPSSAVAAAATASGDVRLDLLGTDRIVREKTRHADGSWTAASVVDGSGTARALSTVSVPNAQPYIVTLAADGTVSDNALQANGSWTRSAVAAPHATGLSAGAAATGELQVDVTADDGRLWSTGRAGTGSWSAPFVVDGAFGHTKDLALTGAPGGDLHIVSLADDGTVWDQARRAAANSWSTSYSGTVLVDGSHHAVAAAAASTPNGDVHVVVLGDDNTVRDIVGHSNGSWDTPAVAEQSGTARAVSAVGLPNGEVHLGVLKADGSVLDTVRHTDGSWASSAVTAPHAGHVAVAATPNGELHLAVVADDGKAWDVLRHADGSWAAPALADGGHTAKSVSAAGSAANEVHLVVLDTAGAAWDNVRRTDGSWAANSAQFGLIDARVSDAPVAFTASGDLHVNQFVTPRIDSAFVKDSTDAKTASAARYAHDTGLEKYLAPYATSSDTHLPQYDTDVTDYMSLAGVNARDASLTAPPVAKASQAAQAKVTAIVKDLIAKNGGQDPFGLYTILGTTTNNGSADDVRRFIEYNGMPQTAPVKGTPEFRIEVEALKARWASGDTTNPVDWQNVLVEAEETASAEWLAEQASQAKPRADILSAELRSLTALQSGTEAMHQALGYAWAASQILKWQAANPSKPMDKATADLATVRNLVTAQAAIARQGANDAKAAADTVDPAVAASNKIADDAGLPHGRGLAYAQQSGDVAKSSAAAALATANALDTAVAATGATAADSATLLANSQAQAAAARAQYLRQSAQDSAATAADLAAGAKTRAAAAASAAADVATAKGQAVQDQADASAANDRAKAAAANAATERQNAANAKADAETQRTGAKQALAGALDKAKAAGDSRGKSQAASSDAATKASAAKLAEDQAAAARNAAAVAQQKKDVATADAQALAAAAVAAQGTAAAADAQTAAQQAATAAAQAATASDQASAQAKTATDAAVAARTAATTAAAASARATAWAADADANALLTWSTAMDAEAAAATAITKSQTAAKNASDAANLASQAGQAALAADTKAVAASQQVDNAVAASATAAGQAYATAQAAATARDAAAAVTAPANTAIALGAPYALTDSSAGLATLASQGALTFAQQQTAVADAASAQAATLATQAAALAAQATGDGKLAAQAASDAAASAAQAAASADAAQQSSAAAASDAAAAKSAATQTAAIDAQAQAQAKAASQSALDANTDSQAAAAAATAGEKDAAAAAAASASADADAKSARGTADQAAASATAAEKSAATAAADSATAEQSATAAEQQLRKDEAALAAQVAAAQQAAQARHDLDARAKIMDNQAQIRIGRANLAYLLHVGGVASKTLATTRLAGPGQADAASWSFFNPDMWNAWNADVVAARDAASGRYQRTQDRQQTVWKYFTTDFAHTEPQYDTAVTQFLDTGNAYLRVGRAAGYGATPEVPQASQAALDRVAQILKDKIAANGDPWNLWSIMLASPQTRGSADDVRRFIQYNGFPTVAPAKGSAEFRLEVESLKTRWASGDPTNPQDPNQVMVEVEETASAEWEAEYAGQAQQRTDIANAEIKALTALQSSAEAMHDALGNAWVANNLMQAQADPHSAWNTYIKDWPTTMGGNFSSDGKPVSVTDDLAAVKSRVDALSATATQNAADAQAADDSASAAVTSAGQSAGANGLPAGRGLSYATESAQVTKAAAAATQATALAMKTAVAATNATVADSGALLANASAQAHAARAAFLRATAQDDAQKAAADAVAAQDKADAAATAAAVAAKDKATIATLQAGSNDAAARAKAAAATAATERQNAATAKATAETQRNAAATANAAAQQQAAAAASSDAAAATDAGNAANDNATAQKAESNAAAAKSRADAARTAFDSSSAKAAAADAAADAAVGTSAADGATAAAKQAGLDADAAAQAADQADADARTATDAAVAARAAATTSGAAAAKSMAAAKVADSAAAQTRANAAQGDALAADAISQAGVAAQNSNAANALAKQAATDSANAKAAADGAQKEADGATADSATAAGQAYAASQQSEIARDTANAVTAPADQAIQLGIAFAATDATAGLAVAVADTSKTLAQQEAVVADVRATEAAAFAAAAQDAANRANGDAKLAAQAAADAAASAAKASRSASDALKSAAQAASDAKDAKAGADQLHVTDTQAQSDAWNAGLSAAAAGNDAAAANAAATAGETDAAAAHTAAANARDSADDAASNATDAQTSANSANQAASTAQADARESAQIAEGAAQLDQNPPAATDTPVASDSDLPGLVIEPVDLKADAHATDQCKWNPDHPLHCSLPADVHITGSGMVYLVTCSLPNAPAAQCIQTGQYQKDSFGSVPIDVTQHRVFNVDMWQQDKTFTKTLAYSMISNFVQCAKDLKHLDPTSNDCLMAVGSIVIPLALKAFLKAALAVRAAWVIGKMVGVEAAVNVLTQTAKAAAIDAFVMSRFSQALKPVMIKDLLQTFLPCVPTHSFSAGTGVLMADGSVKPIQDVRGGDMVENAAPGGGVERHRVENAFTTRTDTEFTDLTVSGPEGRGKITGTQNHPYYDLTRQAFVDASRLTVGDRLQSAGSTPVTVLEVRNYTSAMVTYDLTVSDLHTYFVLAGRTPVLVHNFDCPVGVTVEATEDGITIAHPASGTMTIGILDAWTGKLTLGMDRLDGSTISGKQMFQMVMEHFGDRVEMIQGNWSYGDNLAAFNKLIAEGMPEKTAARATWTGLRAADYGFTSVRISRAVPAADGGYAAVSADFRRP
ncbi:hypothetical protein GCM10009760_14270 [Kitasatospora kazusensis]|uniref:Uncharacterized protein n=1 Tax=Kitasatospora kazusensis TaxID=407974 RepID=A0ABN2Z219_9ACTN